MSRQSRQSADKKLRSRIVNADVKLQPLSAIEQLSVVRTFIQMLEGVYAHLPQKRAMYGQDPVQRLRLLAEHVKNNSQQHRLSDSEFHRRMAEILTDLRDSHTRYIVGANKNRLFVDMLPLLVEHYRESEDDNGYLVSKIKCLSDEEQGIFAEAGFVEGVEITHWNAVPIDRAIELYSANETGGRPDAKRARALESLTLRPKYFMLRPDADWVVITFKTLEGSVSEIKIAWRCIEIDELEDFNTDRPADFARALNPAAESARRVKKNVVCH